MDLLPDSCSVSETLHKQACNHLSLDLIEKEKSENLLKMFSLDGYMSVTRNNPS
jgi:hypothetical protein